MSSMPPTGPPPAPPASAPPAAFHPRFGIRCRSCARTQPPRLPGGYRCIYCDATLPLPRWRAVRPPHTVAPTMVRTVPVTPTPSYGTHHPAWGFPLIAIQSPAAAASPQDQAQAPGGVILIIAALISALASACAAVAESWRYGLGLRGRTALLDAQQVALSDISVLITGWVALCAGIVTALIAVAQLPRWYEGATARAGRRPARNTGQIQLRLLVPGWNLYGLGQVLSEIAALLRLGDAGRRVHRWAIGVLWAAWAASGVVALAALLRAFGASVQARADTVLLHAAVDGLAALVAGLLAIVLISFRRSWLGRDRDRLARWEIVPPSLAHAGQKEPT